MNRHYYACNRCGNTLRTPITNPDNNLVCASCENQFFHEISKSEYDKARTEAPYPK